MQVAAARFLGCLEAVHGGPLPTDAPIALAVSGGPDSMAMLALAHAAYGGQVAVATVDHRLRPEGADEAAMVARYCAALGVAHTILVPETPIAGASIQARARAARYRLLGEWARGSAALLTAHHADDQAETLLMRAARGSGISGLAGIRARRDLGGVALLRPLLTWRRAELRVVAENAGAPFVDDPSNRDDAHDRTRFRRLLEANPWLDPCAIAASAGHLAETETVMNDFTDSYWRDRAQESEGVITLNVADLPRELRRRLVRRAIRAQDPSVSDAANIEALLDSLEAGGGATQAGVMAAARGAVWTFRPAPPRRAH
ncbi:tRNA lysidine(34) synthetase TilS [Sphingomonas sp. LB-2]|uniref:tRNA lysidine(34) synthetase TilS n=1 Tax=Sphingomonas caeni TaxID=2984949 RepID=UPI00222FC269|nr:tRNA lysidine(34) synthetase TilS [Sphingomonas caeni]MCW3846608.1 tRNA lysidine(34) synthetase TilS [Sphingomonas caeni]